MSDTMIHDGATAAAPAAPAPKRSRWPVIAVIVAVIAAAGGVGAFFLLRGEGTAATPEEAIRGFYAALADGSCEEAGAFIDPSFVAPDEVCASFDEVKAGAGSLGAIRSTDLQGEFAYVVAERTVDGLEDQRIVTVKNDPQAGWRVAGGSACYAEEQPQDLGNEHLAPGETYAGYNSVPPTSGPHAPTPSDTGTIFSAPQPSEELVHAMEHGAVVFWTNLQGPLAEHAEEAVLDAYDDGYGSLILTPYADMDTGFAMTAWGTLQTCVGVDADEIRAFVDAHYGSGMEGFLACGAAAAALPACQGNL